jgi:dTMP kinase
VAINGMVPDITFFLDMDPEVAIKRRINSTAADRIEQEKLDFHKRVYDGYKKLSVLYPDRIKTIDAANSVDDISAQIKEHIDELF